MATELKFNQDDEENQMPSLGAPGSAPSSAGGAGAGGMAAGAQSRPATPSGRPNLQQYIQANQGAGQKLAGGIESKLGREAGRLGQEVEKTRGQFGSQAGQIESKVGEEASQFAKSSFKDPQSILNQQDQLGEFRRLQQQGYNQNIQSLSEQQRQQQLGLQQQQQKLAEQAGQARTEGGRFQLLQSAFGQPTYSRGQQKLDQLFLQTQPGVGKQLQQNLQNIQSQAGQQVTGLEKEAQARLGALGQMSKTRADEISKMLSGGLEEGLEGDVSARGLGDIAESSKQQIEAAKAAVAQVPGLRERMRTNQLTSADLQSLGLKSGTSLYDVTDLSPFINQNDPASITAASVADPKEFARYRALQQLAGDTSGDIFSGATEAGGFKPYQTENISGLLDARKQYWEKQKLNEMLGAYGQEQFGPNYNYQPSAPVDANLAAVNQEYQNALLRGDFSGIGSALSQLPSGVSNLTQTLTNPFGSNPIQFSASNAQVNRRTANANRILAAQTAEEMEKAMRDYASAEGMSYEQAWNVGNERNVGKKMYQYLQDLYKKRQNVLNENVSDMAPNTFQVK